jgi:hypothetical protein
MAMLRFRRRTVRRTWLLTTTSMLLTAHRGCPLGASFAVPRRKGEYV